MLNARDSFYTSKESTLPSPMQMRAYLSRTKSKHFFNKRPSTRSELSLSALVRLLLSSWTTAWCLLEIPVLLGDLLVGHLDSMTAFHSGNLVDLVFATSSNILQTNSAY